MLDEVISREAAIDALADYIHNVDKVMGTGHLTEDDCKDAAASVFEELPSVERKKGKWNCEDDMFEYAVCSSCKWDSGEAWEYAKKYFRYCPNCGADMRGDNDE